MTNVSLAILVLLTSLSSAVFAEEQFCSDSVCKKIENQYFKKEYEKLVSAINPREKYSEGSVFYIGMSYTMLAEKAHLLETKEKLYRQAIAIRYYPAYMSLYNLYREKNHETATGLLKEYVKTNPDDPAPFVVLGEIEFNSKSYKDADKYLRRAKKLSKSHTSGLDWLLFKTNYVLGNYEYSSKMFDSAIAQSRFTEEIQAIKTDPRFAGIEDRPEFKQYKSLLNKKGQRQ